MGLFFSLLPLTASFAAGAGGDRDSAARCRARVRGRQRIAAGLWLVAYQGDRAGSRGFPGRVRVAAGPEEGCSAGLCCHIAHPASPGSLRK